MGKDGNLYFANLLTKDSRNDYTCNIQYLTARTILAKEPTTLTVSPCKVFCCSRTSINISSESAVAYTSIFFIFLTYTRRVILRNLHCFGFDS